MTEMAIVIYGDATAVHPNFIGFNGGKGFLAMGQTVE
jgi:hypothetical protein